jgi:hypothetical protein
LFADCAGDCAVLASIVQFAVAVSAPSKDEVFYRLLILKSIQDPRPWGAVVPGVQDLTKI